MSIPRRPSLACFAPAALLLAACGAAPVEVSPPLVLTDAEVTEGWRVLFDGETLDGWRLFRRGDVTKGWKVVDGDIARVGTGGDLITVEQFGSFILELEWMISEGGNSGILFRVTEDREEVWETGPEMQILDNAAFGSALSPKASAGANYALHAPVRDFTNPVWEWNHVRLEVRGPNVVHYLNGHKLLEYTLWSPEWKALVADTKFAAMPDYGMNRRGHIALQDHGDAVWFRNVKILPLD